LVEVNKLTKPKNEIFLGTVVRQKAVNEINYQYPENYLTKVYINDFRTEINNYEISMSPNEEVPHYNLMIPHYIRSEFFMQDGKKVISYPNHDNTVSHLFDKQQYADDEIKVVLSYQDKFLKYTRNQIRKMRQTNIMNEETTAFFKLRKQYKKIKKKKKDKANKTMFKFDSILAYLEIRLIDGTIFYVQKVSDDLIEEFENNFKKIHLSRNLMKRAEVFHKILGLQYFLEKENIFQRSLLTQDSFCKVLESKIINNMVIVKPTDEVMEMAQSFDLSYYIDEVYYARKGDKLHKDELIPMSKKEQKLFLYFSAKDRSVYNLEKVEFNQNYSTPDINLMMQKYKTVHLCENENRFRELILKKYVPSIKNRKIRFAFVLEKEEDITVTITRLKTENQLLFRNRFLKENKYPTISNLTTNEIVIRDYYAYIKSKIEQYSYYVLFMKEILKIPLDLLSTDHYGFYKQKYKIDNLLKFRQNKQELISFFNQFQ
jgi:hypothetical protein